MENLELTTSQILGTIFYTLVIFSGGAWLGPRFFGWLNKFMPWSKD